MKAWLARTLVIVFVITTPPATAAPLAALPSTIRVNISGLGTTHARIGSTGSVVVTMDDGTVLFRGFISTIVRRGVPRLADASHAAASLPDPEERRNRAAELREARLAARVDDVAIVTVPFEFSVEDDGSSPLKAPLFSAQQITSLHFATSDGLLTYNGNAFRGTFDLTRDDEGDMIVVNQVDTLAYLASVVGSEEPPSWMPEALAAQTYLVTHMRRHASYDLEGDARDQEYDGLGGETTSTVRATLRTAGLVATYRGAPIEALYSANAGGVTEDSENVYANALPYLRAVPSPGDEAAMVSSWGRTSWEWTTEYTAPQLRSYLGARGIDIGDVQRIGPDKSFRYRSRHVGADRRLEWQPRHRQGQVALLLRTPELALHRHHAPGRDRVRLSVRVRHRPRWAAGAAGREGRADLPPQPPRPRPLRQAAGRRMDVPASGAICLQRSRATGMVLECRSGARREWHSRASPPRRS